MKLETQDVLFQVFGLGWSKADTSLIVSGDDSGHIF